MALGSKRAVSRRASTLGAWLGLMGLAGFGVVAAAQDGEAGGGDEQTAVIEPRGGGVDATPVAGSGAAGEFPLELGRAMFHPSAAHLVPEATMLVDRRGRVHRLATGRLVFVFDADATGQADPPMFLQPCVKTMQLERLIAGRGPDTTVRVTGQVTAYRGWNYLRPTTLAVLERPIVEAGASGASAPAKTPAPPTEEATSLDDLFGQPVRSADGTTRTAADVLAELETRQPEEGVYTPPAVVEISDARGVLAEGRVLVSRRGRLRTHAGGGLEFVFDAGPNDPPGMDQPLILLPCLLLERIEAAVNRRRSVGLTLSGQVFGYGDHAFVLPTMFVLERSRPENVVPAQ